MENQHRKITGYRELTPEEIELMNEIKTLGMCCGDLVAKLRKLEYKTKSKIPLEPPEAVQIAMADQRWVAIAQTQLQQGFMALTRSIAKPESF